MICSRQLLTFACAIVAINLIGPTWRQSDKFSPVAVAIAAQAYDNVQQNHLVPATATRYELKFQTELDNSTVIKQVGQQQSFKCQVRLAPLTGNGANLQQQLAERPRFKSASRAIEAQSDGAKSLNIEQITLASSSNSNSNIKWPPTAAAAAALPLAASINVTYIAIDWFKDEQPIVDKSHQVAGSEKSGATGGGLDEPIAVINVTLKSRTNKAKIKSRIEIKNTLNGSQLKLTSRLRVSHLKSTDSGQYKCVARANFVIVQHQQQQQQKSNQHSNKNNNNNNNNNDHELLASGPSFILFEQSLESNATTLVIVSTVSSDSSRSSSGSSNSVQQQASNEEANNNRSWLASQIFGRKKWISTSDLASAKTNQQRQQHQHQQGSDLFKGVHNSQQTGVDSGETKHRGDTQANQKIGEAGLDRGSISSGQGQLEGNQSSGASSERDYNQGGLGLFEDDEDLFRMDSTDLTELVNGQGKESNDDNINGNNMDNGALTQEPSIEAVDNNSDSGIDRDLLAQTYPQKKSSTLREQQQQQQQRQQDAYLDWILGESGDIHPVDTGADVNVKDNKAAPFGKSFELSPVLNNELANGDVLNQASNNPPAGKQSTVQSDSHDSNLLQHASRHYNQVNSFLASDSQSSDLSSAKFKLAKFVHKIAPELSCYTGVGEYYHGHIATSVDGRACLNWFHIRLSLAQKNKTRPQDNNQAALNRLGDLITSQAAAATAAARNDNHNYCRNPNMDQRGPWCFVAYSETQDGLILPVTATATATQISRQQALMSATKLTTTKHRVARVGANRQLFVIRSCNIASCSEYLWLYVVAPPLGLLVLLTCLIGVLIRSIRKSHYNAIFSAAYERHSNTSGGGGGGGGGASSKSAPSSSGIIASGLCNVFKSSKRFTQKRCFDASCKSLNKNKSKSSVGNYLDDDIFEIVDWNDGQTHSQSMSSKSCESFKLNSASFESSTKSDKCGAKNHLNYHEQQATNGNKSTLTHSKSINPMFIGRELPEPGSKTPAPAQRTMSNMSKSKSQAGPMFATLRCLVQNTQQRRQVDSIRSQQQQQQQQAKKSSSFIDKCDLATGNGNIISNGSNCNGNKLTGGTCHDWLTSSVTSNLSSFQGSNIESSAPSSSAASPLSSSSSSSSAAKTGHLISCMSSSSSSSNNTIATNGSPILASNNINDNNLIDTNDKCILASDLPRLDLSSVTVTCDTQAIYEGKFSHVQMAHLKQQEGDLTKATGRIGTQVAVCALKQQAALDESVFVATNLRLRNLNHVNILKLIGYIQYDDSSNSYANSRTKQNDCNPLVAINTCALVYDMAHLIDLSDWLKSIRCKDAVIAQNNDVSGDLNLRQNLSCLAKQIALAVDYLHDKNIVYKDLACRNCFLDVARMLVKLASFNVELEFDNNNNNNGGCVDYQNNSAVSASSNDASYPTVANYGHSDDDMIMVSRRLNLKSMVRPKYLLDYYVIDSRPSECQLLPLSWTPLESILFNKFNKQTDIWSFGCLLYELFSLGEVAYFGYSSKQVIDSVRSNLMPPQPLLCPNGIYKLMCICLSDIPTLRPNIKHVYEQLNLYSGQCSCFMNHHLCTR